MYGGKDRGEGDFGARGGLNFFQTLKWGGFFSCITHKHFLIIVTKAVFIKKILGL